jgi:hypothetical protein
VYEYLLFLKSISFLPFTFTQLPEAFGLTVAKSWYPHYFNTRANLYYVDKIPDISYYSEDEMSTSECVEFFVWYEGQKKKVVDGFCTETITV